MARFVGLDVSQKLTALCVVDETGRRLWRGQCATDPGQIELTVRGHAGEDAKIGVETGPMTPWLVHELRGRVRIPTRLLSGSGVVAGTSRDQAGDEGAKQGFATSPSIVHELEEAEVERQLVLRDAPMRAQPGAQQRPEALCGRP